MLALIFGRRTRSSIHPSFSLLFSTSTHTRHQSILTSSFFPRANQSQITFRDWFLTRKNPLFDQIYRILYQTEDESSINSSLAEFNLHLTQQFVLDVLTYHNNKDVFASLKFFDWTGRQKGFHHSAVIYNAIFKLLHGAGKNDVILEYLQHYERNSKYAGKASFQSILIIGYAVSGRCDLALRVLGRLRFAGGDLNDHAYHVLLDSLIEHRHFDVVDTYVKQILARGYATAVTHNIVVKSLCRQMKLDDAEKYLYELIMSGDGVADKCGPAVSTMVSSLCRDEQYKRAALLVEELRKKGVVSMDYAYSAWIRGLLYSGKLDGALKFFKDKSLEGYVPDVFGYSMLVSTLLRQNRFDDVYDLLVEMKDLRIMPDEVALSSVLCLSCKLGRLDIAMDMYNSREEFGLSVNYMAYNYLINTLLGDASADQAYGVFMNAIEQGYFPGEITFLIIASALCREGKSDQMKDLVEFTLETAEMRSSTYEKLIRTLCAANRVRDGYWVYERLNRSDTSTRHTTTYTSLISGCIELGEVEIAIELVMKMHEKGISCTEEIFREVIYCICNTDNPEKLLFRFLEMQLSIPGMSASKIFQRFIDGAGHARKPILAKKLHILMEGIGVEVDWIHERNMLQSYIYGGNIIKAEHLFHDMCERWPGKSSRLWDDWVINLCRVGEPDLAALKMVTMKSVGKCPRTMCYEELIKSYCDLGQFHKAIHIVNDMAKIPKPISTFIGNTFMLHALKSPILCRKWVYNATNTENLMDACRKLCCLIGVFSDLIKGNYSFEEIETLIQECFPMDVFTCNMLLRKAGYLGVDNVFRYFHRMRETGYEPNRWTYNILVHALLKEGHMSEAKRLMSEMHAKGYRLLDINEKFM